MLLAIEGLSVNYGGLAALRGVSVWVEQGQFVAIVGPNGAGKTTLFKAISGVVPAGAGAITYEGQNLLTIPAHQRMHLGIAHVPEGRQVFAAMAVLENLEMGAYSAGRRSTWQRNIDRIFALFPVLAGRRSQLAGTLSGGEQQMLAIGRGIASSPQLLLLDEPSMGLAPAIADLIFDRSPANGRNRRISPNVVALVNSGEGLLTRPIAGARSEQRKLIFMPAVATPSCGSSTMLQNSNG